MMPVDINSIFGTLIMLLAPLALLAYIVIREIQNRTRRSRAFKFLSELSDLVRETNASLIRNATPENIMMTEDLVEKKTMLYARMKYTNVLYSFKPFELSSWFSNEEIQILRQDKIDETC